jgi:hypothetical protein
MKQQYLLGKEVASEMAAIMKAQPRSVIAKPFEKTAAKKEDDKEAAAKEKAKDKAKKEKEKEKAKAKKEKDKKKAKKTAAETLRKSVSGLAKISEVLDNLGLVRGSLATLGALDCLVKEAIAKSAHQIPDGEREGALDAGETVTPAPSAAPAPAKDKSNAEEDKPKEEPEEDKADDEKLAAYDSLLLKLGSK